MPASQFPVTQEATSAIEVLRATCPEAIQTITQDGGDLAITLDRAVAVKACTALRDDPRTRFDMFAYLCGVDWWEFREVRFDVVVHLYSVPLNHRVRLIFPVPEDDARIDSLVGVWKGANWFERECWDMFGIVFTGHPWLKRILCHDDFQGHPLRKDYDATLRHPYGGDTELPPHLFENIPAPRPGGEIA
jgi:NADH-quinone oxidoreductase subunit C